MAFQQANAQKFALLDKTMSLPLSYTNTVTIKDEYRNMFAVEKEKLPEFLSAIDKIESQILKKEIPETFTFYIGSTRFYGLKIPLKTEDRMDVVLTTDCGNQKISMHLSDGKVSNASNIFFIKTWKSYIRDNIKNLK